MEDLVWCIEYLKKINNFNFDLDLSKENEFRALMNITMPYNLSEEFYLKQDKVLQERLSKLEIVDSSKLKEIKPQIYLYKGDITKLKCDAIVNACNEKILGCFQMLHNCIDNQIHSFSGLQVRRDLLEVMEKQGHDEENGQCKVTKGYNLPSKYIFHTVGPKVFGRLNKKDEEDLKNCYLSCLKEASKMGLETIAFSSISTGVYGFPKEKASEIAVSTVKEFLKTSNLKVIFDTFSEEDYAIYYRTIEEIY